MEITFDVVKSLVDTFPIGLYANRRIEMSLDKESDKTFYSPMEDKIVVSFPMIHSAFKTIPEGETVDIESVARGLVYHEVSHAILTPIDLISSYETATNKKVLNLFEDERIETVLDGYYLDVNFKKLVFLMNGGIHTPTNIDEAFYNLVRFRVCDDETFIKRVADIIDKYAEVNASYVRDYDYYDYDKNNKTYHYRNAVLDLYKDFCKAYKNKLPQTEEMQSYMTSMIQNSDNNANGNTVQANIEGSDKGGENAEGEGNEMSMTDENGNPIEKDENSEEMKPYGRNAGGGKYNFDNLVSGLNFFIDTGLTSTLEMIIGQFNKKNKSGSGITSYSGIFSPRNIVNNDYRYFDRSLSVNGNNSFGTFHLNLFIDHSGSFCPNDHSVNTLVKSLTEVEKRNKNFTFDVIFVGVGFDEPKTVKERFIVSNGGNRLQYKEVKEVFSKHQLPNTFNYNILLLDGDCGCVESTKTLMPFDKNNCTLIVERSNARYLNNFRSAKVKYVNDNYPEKLKTEVVNALSIAFH